MHLCVQVCVCACVFFHVLGYAKGLQSAMLQLMDRGDKAITLPGGLICMFVNCCFLQRAYRRYRQLTIQCEKYMNTCHDPFKQSFGYRFVPAFAHRVTNALIKTGSSHYLSYIKKIPAVAQARLSVRLLAVSVILTAQNLIYMSGR